MATITTDTINDIREEGARLAAALATIERDAAALRTQLAAFGLAPEQTYGTLREAVDVVLRDFDEFGIDEFKAAVRARYHVADGSSIHTALKRAVDQRKVTRLGNSRYRVNEEWKAKMHT